MDSGLWFCTAKSQKESQRKVTLGPSVGCLWSGEPPMGRASNQTYPKHVEATLRLLDRIAKKKTIIFFQVFKGYQDVIGTWTASLGPWIPSNFSVPWFHQSVLEMQAEGAWHGFFPARTNHHNQFISFDTWCYSLMMLHVVPACSRFHILVTSSAPFPRQGRTPPFKTELPPPPPMDNDLDSAPWRSSQVVPPMNKDAAWRGWEDFGFIVSKWYQLLTGTWKLARVDDFPVFSCKTWWFSVVCLGSWMEIV